MKNVFFIRHAKSSWENFGLRDIERPLNPRGKRDAPKMAEFLASEIKSLDLIISSPANRAISTARHFAKAFGLSKDQIKVKDNIYHGDDDDYLEAIQEIENNDYKSVALFGHNPTMTYLTNTFTDENIANVPTCGISHVCDEVQAWSDWGENGILKAFYYPKMFAK